MRGFSQFVPALLLAAALAAGAVQAQPGKDAGTQGRPDHPFTGYFPTADAHAAALIGVFRRPNKGQQSDEEEWHAEKLLVGLGKAAVPRLLDGVVDADYHVSTKCAELIRRIGRPAVEDVRARWPKLDHTARWRLMPFRGQHDYIKAADYALDCLKEKDDKLRAEAWYFLLEHKEKRVAEEFYRNLRGESDFPPCYCVIRRQPVFDAEKEIDLLIALLSPDSWLAVDRGFPQRRTSARPNDERIMAIEALGARKAKRAAPELLKVLAERGPGRAYYGTQIIPLLGEFGHKEAIPELKRILDTDPKEIARTRWRYDPDRVKMLAARSLFQLGDPKGREYLTPLPDKQPAWGDRRFAAESFALYGDKSDIPLLARLLDDSDWGVRRAACEGLERITGVNIHAPIQPTRKSNEADAALWKEWYQKVHGKKP